MAPRSGVCWPIMTLDDFEFLEIQVDPAEIERWESEDSFIDRGIDLFREVAKIGAILSCIMPPRPVDGMGYWNREQAIFGGLLIRLSKLQHGFMILTCKNCREVARLVFRSVFETAVNLLYLAERGSPELYERFVRYSLWTDKKLLARVDLNVHRRGYELPIEKRIVTSVETLFRKSGVDISSITDEDKRSWAGSLYDRAEAVGYGEMYLATFSLTSHEVHGNWGDLVEHHLESSPDGFLPETRYSPARTYEILAAGLLSAESYERYARRSVSRSEDRELLLRRLGIYKERLALLSNLFEVFVTRQEGSQG